MSNIYGVCLCQLTLTDEYIFTSINNALWRYTRVDDTFNIASRPLKLANAYLCRHPPLLNSVVGIPRLSSQTVSSLPWACQCCHGQNSLILSLWVGFDYKSYLSRIIVLRPSVPFLCTSAIYRGSANNTCGLDFLFLPPGCTPVPHRVKVECEYCLDCGWCNKKNTFFKGIGRK